MTLIDPTTPNQRQIVNVGVLCQEIRELKAAVLALQKAAAKGSPRAKRARVQRKRAATG